VAGNRRADNLNPLQATALFRIVQEALTNVVRHASASAVSIWINGSARETSLKIQDNGVGMTDAQQNGAGGIGLLGMRERTEQMAGTLTITSRPGRGTAIRVVAPAPPRPEKADP
jgi:signal transduction histidine kinase